MTITFYCPACGQKTQVPDSTVGKVGTCACGARVQVPKPSDPLPLLAGESDEDQEAGGRDWHTPPVDMPAILTRGESPEKWHPTPPGNSETKNWLLGIALFVLVPALGIVAAAVPILILVLSYRWWGLWGAVLALLFAEPIIGIALAIVFSACGMLWRLASRLVGADPSQFGTASLDSIDTDPGGE